MDAHPAPARIVDLSYDAIFEICRFLDAVEIVNMLSICRKLHAYCLEYPLWAHLSARFGITDTKYFGSRDFRSIYTALLHPYGPLLGLWAGDHPFTGHMMEFVLDSGCETRPGGIFGEMWTFPHVQPEDADYDTLQMPEQPLYRRILRIGFTADPDNPRVQIFCCAGGVERSHHGALKVVSKTEQNFFLHTRLGPFAHPNFPGPRFLFPVLPGTNADGWHDKLRPLPRVPEELQTVVDQSFLLNNVVNPRVPIILSTRTSHTNPRAITIECTSRCMHKNAPFLGFENRIQSLPRYYPVCGDIQVGVDPTSGDWSPQSLLGLWLGAHGGHGTECIYLDWHQTYSRIVACKVTGDENVPRGALSWNMLTSNPYSVEDGQREILEQTFGSLSRCRLFRAEAMISERGYMPHHRTIIDAVCAVVGSNELRIWYPLISLSSAFIRYQGRVPPSSKSSSEAA